MNGMEGGGDKVTVYFEFIHNMVVNWRAKMEDFLDFKGCVKLAFKNTHKYCGGVMIIPQWYQPMTMFRSGKTKMFSIRSSLSQRIGPGSTLQQNGKPPEAIQPIMKNMVS
jgi:hypothetical protein